ncbi:hypothetical protein J6590_005559 [Homalodisca vitripennis]|nr:hypothetical protein J6590_005559 [Homalodisca vitripennis]
MFSLVSNETYRWLDPVAGAAVACRSPSTVGRGPRLRGLRNPKSGPRRGIRFRHPQMPTEPSSSKADHTLAKHNEQGCPTIPGLILQLFTQDRSLELPKLLIIVERGCPIIPDLILQLFTQDRSLELPKLLIIVERGCPIIPDLILQLFTQDRSLELPKLLIIVYTAIKLTLSVVAVSEAVL